MGLLRCLSQYFPIVSLEKKGWLQIKDELGLELLDCGASRAFAITDHQVANIYLNDPSIETEVRNALEKLPGVAKSTTAALDRKSVSTTIVLAT